MVDAEVQTDAPMPAAVVGVEQDLLMGVRVRKSFGSHAFWGTVVGCYWVSGGLFYKVSFDDGDVDIFSADEVLQDAQQAKTHAKENAKENAQKDPASSETPVDEYLTTMRHHSLKRKRDEPVDTSVRSVRRVQLWGQRLYASIYTNEQNETFIKELIKTDSGQMGEMEATGQVKVGDMILAVNQKRVLGLESKDVAELIKKPQRPIVLTLYRPQHSQLPVQQQQAGQASAPAPEQAQGAATTQPAAVVTQPQAQQQAPASAPMRVLPASFVAPQRAFAQPASMGPGLAQSWTQPMNTHGMTNRELLRQRLIQAAAARQPGYFPMTGVFAPANRGVPTAQRGGLTDQQMQRIVDAAAMRLHASAGQSVRPMHQSQSSAQAPQYNMGRYQPQRSGLALYEQALQMQRTSYGPDGHASQQPPFTLRPAQAMSKGAHASRLPTVSPAEPGQRTEPPQPRRDQQNISSSRQNYTQGPTSDWSSADNTPREDPPVSSTDNADAEAIAALAEKDPAAAASAMATSFLSPQACPDSKAGAASTAESSLSMSFLSPNDFNEESRMPPRRDLSAGSAKSTPSPVKSNVSLTTVVVHRQRLYLTLGVQGALIAVTSFVSDETGQRGEVEASGRVFLGDVLVRINDTYISPGMTPGNVAGIVNSSSRPITLWFERASWDVLTGI
ncbi:hypothetical protein PRIC1_014407 [Phytophthora ramorum]|uniref:uncharacterized protein n=1 Tax=Phytophthora ramorum TaxID=164328 RepID=UPI00309B493D|nr:hypothetical protein KRP23_8229 [Phytophthora ramorum]